MKCAKCGGRQWFCRGPLGADTKSSGKKRGRRTDAANACGEAAKRRLGDDTAMSDPRSSTHDWLEGELGDDDWGLDSENTFSLQGLSDSLPTLRLSSKGHIPACPSDCCGTVWQKIVEVLDSRGDEGECFIGRLSDNDIIFLQDPLVSRVHAKIVRVGSTFYLQDLSSSNGTIIADCKMKPNEIQSLNARDTVVMGKSLFHVMDGCLY